MDAGLNVLVRDDVELALEGLLVVSAQLDAQPVILGFRGYELPVVNFLQDRYQPCACIGVGIFIVSLMVSLNRRTALVLPQKFRNFRSYSKLTDDQIM